MLQPSTLCAATTAWLSQQVSAGATVGTLLVDDIGPYFAQMAAQGAEVVHLPAERLGGAGSPPGRHRH
jgi:hypothetical protein